MYKSSSQGAQATRVCKQGSNQGGKQGRAQQFARQFAQAGRSPLLATQLVDIALPGDILAMVSTHGRAFARRSMGTQMEAPCKHTAVQVCGCRECLSLALVPEDSRDNGCVRVRPGE